MIEEGLGKVKQMEKAEVTLMVPHDDGHWEPETVMKNLWKCVECGNVWKTRREAQSCKGREHRESYVRFYGGYFQNGVHTGGMEIAYSIVRKEPL